ncbi:MAG: paraquat-inducible protein A [Methylococcales bacterium]
MLKLQVFSCPPIPIIIKCQKKYDLSRSFTKKMNIIHYDACPECDLLLNPNTASVGEKAHCPRCGLLLSRPSKRSVERTFALSIAGLILFFPANLLPMVGITMMGNANTGVLYSGVVALFNNGMVAVAAVVFLASILFPLVHIILSLLISGHLYFNYPNRYLAHWMRWMHHLDEWVMLEVYMLSIIVACVKLMSLAKLEFGWGLYAFIALIVITTLLTGNLDNNLFWQRIHQLSNRDNNAS